MTSDHPGLADVIAKLSIMQAQLDSIERQLGRVVYRDVYDLQHQRVGERLDSLETAAVKAAADRRATIVGVGIALIVPILGAADDIARWLVR